MFNYDSFSLLYLSSLSPAHIYIFQQGQTHPLTAASLQFPWFLGWPIQPFLADVMVF